MLGKKKGGRPSKKPSAVELDLMYSQMSAREVGEHYGVTEQTVRKWIQAYRSEMVEFAKEG